MDEPRICEAGAISDTSFRGSDMTCGNRSWENKRIHCDFFCGLEKNTALQTFSLPVALMIVHNESFNFRM